MAHNLQRLEKRRRLFAWLIVWLNNLLVVSSVVAFIIWYFYPTEDFWTDGTHLSSWITTTISFLLTSVGLEMLAERCPGRRTWSKSHRYFIVSFVVIQMFLVGHVVARFILGVTYDRAQDTVNAWTLCRNILDLIQSATMCLMAFAYWGWGKGTLATVLTRWPYNEAYEMM